MATATPDSISESTARAAFIAYLNVYYHASSLGADGKSWGDVVNYYDNRYPGFIGSFGRSMYGVNRDYVNDVALDLANRYPHDFPDPAVWNSAFMERLGTTTWGDIWSATKITAEDTAKSVSDFSISTASKVVNGVIVALIVYVIVELWLLSPGGLFKRRRRA